VTSTTETTESAPFTGPALGVPSRTASRCRTATRTTVLLLVIGTRTLVPLERWTSTSRGRVRWCGSESRSLRLDADRSTLSSQYEVKIECHKCRSFQYLKPIFFFLCTHLISLDVTVRCFRMLVFMSKIDTAMYHPFANVHLHQYLPKRKHNKPGYHCSTLQQRHCKSYAPKSPPSKSPHPYHPPPTSHTPVHYSPR
jgi:hypothetical protein